MFEPQRLPPPDEMGFFFHPDIPYIDQEANLTTALRRAGFEASFVPMEGTAPMSDVDAYFDGDTSVARNWTPPPPAGGRWQLIAKYDTEDGPHALFVKPI